MKKLALVLVIIFSLITFAGMAYAQESSATKAADKKSAASERAKDRLEQLKSRRATKSVQAKEKVRDQARRRAHVLGEITAINGTTLIIRTRSDETKTILTNTETKFLQIGKGSKKEIKFADLKIGDRIAAVGIARDENSGIAKFVVKLTKSDKSRHAVFGKVSTVGDNQLTLSQVIHKDKPTTTVKTTSETKFKIRGKDGGSFSDIKVGDRVAASGTVDNEGMITAKRLFVIPGKAVGIKPKPATKSATSSSSN